MILLLEKPQLNVNVIQMYTSMKKRDYSRAHECKMSEDLHNESGCSMTLSRAKLSLETLLR